MFKVFRDIDLRTVILSYLIFVRLVRDDCKLSRLK